MPDCADAPVDERTRPRDRTDDAFAGITALLRRYLRKQLIKESAGAAVRLPFESAVTQENKAELVRQLDRLHAADVANLLEALPLDERLYTWDLIRASRDGDILLGVSDAVRESFSGWRRCS